jgi:hypothetical protein
MTICSFCNVPGHNKRTCAFFEMSACLIGEQYCVPVPSSPPVAKRKYTCSHCNGVGHNSRSCGLKGPSMLETGTMPGFTWDWWSKSSTPEVNKIKKVKKTNRCASCGDMGHNARTCTLKHMSISPAPTTPRNIPRKARIPDTPNRGVQVTQVVDFDIYDEPWVWAPVRPVNRRLTLSSSPLVLP